MIPRHFHLISNSNKIEIKTLSTVLANKLKDIMPHFKITVWYDNELKDCDFLLFNKYKDRCNSGAQVSDLLRLDVLYKYGGLYLDNDFEVIQSLEPLIDVFDEIWCSENGYILPNSFFGVPKKSPILSEIIKFLLMNEPDWKLSPEKTTGPCLFGRFPHLFKRVLPVRTFYPFYYNELRVEPFNKTYCVHLWEGTWNNGHTKCKSIPSNNKWSSRTGGWILIHYEGDGFSTNQLIKILVSLLSRYTSLLIRDLTTGHYYLLSSRFKEATRISSTFNESIVEIQLEINYKSYAGKIKICIIVFYNSIYTKMNNMNQRFRGFIGLLKKMNVLLN